MPKNFIKTERKIEKLFPVGGTFRFEEKEYKIDICGKPRPSSGECKTDVYVKGVAADGKEIELKISVKQDNAHFAENKISLERAREIFGHNASDILKKCVKSIKKHFVSDFLVCFEQNGKTEAHTMKLGWRFELLNRPGGNKAGEMELTDSQKIDVLAGINMPKDKKDSNVNGQTIENSGVANYILYVGANDMTQDECLKKLQPIKEFAKTQKFYFVCKALNYRFDKKKWDGTRPLAVYVKWFIYDGKLNAHLVLDEPLAHKGNEAGNKLKQLLDKLNIETFDDLKTVLSPDVNCFYGEEKPADKTS